MIKRAHKIVKRAVKPPKRDPKSMKNLFKTVYYWVYSMNCVMQGMFFSVDSWRIETKTFFPRI